MGWWGLHSESHLDLIFTAAHTIWPPQGVDAALKSEDPSAAVSLGDLAVVHATSAGLKALVCGLTADGLEDCRKCCGGHGVLLASGVAHMAQASLLLLPTVLRFPALPACRVLAGPASYTYQTLSPFPHKQPPCRHTTMSTATVATAAHTVITARPGS